MKQMTQNCTNRTTRRGNCDCQKTMQMLRALDFAIQETVLYLDAYPDCREALTYYHRLIAERREVMERYEEGCAPVTMYGNRSEKEWNWIDAPWPWEPEAN